MSETQAEREERIRFKAHGPKPITLHLSEQARVHLLSVLADSQAWLAVRAKPFRDDSRTSPSVIAYIDSIVSAVADTRKQLQQQKGTEQ